jgi:hypothetical protein
MAGWMLLVAGAEKEKDNRRGPFHRCEFYAFVINPARKETEMDDIERNGDSAEDDEQFEQMIIENSILLHSLGALLVRKGVLKQEEIDEEMDKLYEEMEKFDEE